MLAFVLSMPGCNSWNGRWSGDERCHALVRRVSDKKEASLIGHYHYHFGDGWVAGVEVRQVERAEASRLRRKSVGFCGYDWMVDSIVLHGEIRGPRSKEATHADTL